MDTSAIAVLLYYILCLVLALTVVALTIVYKMRLPSSKGVRELKREGGQQEESAHEKNTEGRPVLNSSSGRGIQKQAISSGEKPLKPEPAVNEVPSEAEKTGKAGKKIESGEEQVQIQEKDTAPIRRLQPKGPIKAYSGSQYTTITGAPQGQLAITEPKSGQVPSHESLPDNTSPAGEKNDAASIAEPAPIGKESEASMNAGSGTGVNQASSETPAATTDSDVTDQEMPQKQKSGLGDLADLFATNASDFIEKNRLAEEVNDIDINELLQEGLGLLGKVKKTGG